MCGRGFVELVLGMSFFSIDKIANIAANDFLRNPVPPTLDSSHLHSR